MSSDLCVRPFPLSIGVREAVRIQAALAEAKGVRFNLELLAPVFIRGNSGLLVECASHIVENAIRHTPDGGTVSIRAEATPTPGSA